MKKVFLIICLLLPVCLAARDGLAVQDSLAVQNVRKHHFELGFGGVKPGEIFFETVSKEALSAGVYGEYRFDITPALSVGAMYSFVIPHSLETESYVATTNYHTLNAILEYTVASYGPFGLFVGIGAGAQCRIFSSDKYGYNSSEAYFSTDMSVHVGMEFFKHLRLTAGHMHDLHYPISILPSGAPYYFINLGWSF